MHHAHPCVPLGNSRAPATHHDAPQQTTYPYTSHPKNTAYPHQYFPTSTDKSTRQKPGAEVRVPGAAGANPGEASPEPGVDTPRTTSLDRGSAPIKALGAFKFARSHLRPFLDSARQAASDDAQQYFFDWQTLFVQIMYYSMLVSLSHTRCINKCVMLTLNSITVVHNCNRLTP